jgi:hypothetical protein
VKENRRVEPLQLSWLVAGRLLSEIGTDTTELPCFPMFLVPVKDPTLYQPMAQTGRPGKPAEVTDVTDPVTRVTTICWLLGFWIVRLRVAGVVGLIGPTTEPTRVIE